MKAKFGFRVSGSLIPNRYNMAEPSEPMNIHEYQAKDILARHGIRVPRGQVAFDLRDAEAAAQGIGPGPFVVKAQVHAGGRGKAGGIRKANDPGKSGRSPGPCSE